ncbi:hypothetical protein EK21DRAFT_110714 [Setomelanomma holmii]|uniref:Uncharacterized protein n=1 Tax=Setomelanomma holmii TaxID=210430 RepID=A0A9P4HBL1_9PLEO|nr:hypothetical protein EK21DRAFT_110714 [Setomelanomma holmii]
MRYLHAQQMLGCISSISAFAIRDAPLNLTTIAPWEPIQTVPTGTSSHPSALFKPHLESKADGFDGLPTATINRNIVTTTPTVPDIGSLIQSYLSATIVISSAAGAPHLEQSQSGWGDATQDESTPTPIFHPPHLEAPADDSDGVITPPVYSARLTTPAAEAQPIVTPPPVITKGGLTLQPEPVTSASVVTVDGKATTIAGVVGYRYVVGSATLAIGATTTVNNVIIALSLDSTGNTILVADGQTTTVAPAAQYTQLALATHGPQGIVVSTTVIDGTTKYVLAGQTLAPGQAVTVGTVPISIGTAGSSTVLVLGDVTTTLPVRTMTTATGPGSSTTATPTVGSGNGKSSPATTSAKAEAGDSRRASWSLVRAIGFVALIQHMV